MRAVGAILQRFSYGVCFKCPTTCFAPLRNGLLGRSPLSSLSSYSCYSGFTLFYEEKHSHCQVNGAQDAKKAKLYSRIGKEVVSAVKKGGPNPISNTALAAVLRKPRNLMYLRKFWSAILRGLLRRDKRLILRKSMRCDKDQLLTIALDAGAEDVIEPPIYDDDTDEDSSASYYKVVSSSEDYAEILSKLREEGIKFETDNGSELLPLTTIEVDDEAMDLNKELMSKLLELDDVDAVYTDQK
ncbi:hypothetical protein GH714_031028 [Hevea brasiliensis]|uniref:Transcriptional regulator TACO1-like protein n=1 Tax=Hevea brasiliensis TaxID=3981 RepID=A0A6A6LXN3_HEVBR|nr:hypothetical protein GH714_031028 [Hevea brasiliensis]